MTIRSILLVAHRWVGIGSAAFIVVMGVTGAMLVWPGTSSVRRAAEALHDTLALGRPGWVIIVLSTAAAAGLQLSGLVLWWRRKSLRIETGRGWRRLVFDMHNALGAVFLLVMLAIAGSGLARVGLRYVDRPVRYPALQRTVSRVHTTQGFSAPMKAVFLVGSLGLAVQGVTGVLIWWKPRSNSAERGRTVIPDAGA